MKRRRKKKLDTSENIIYCIIRLMRTARCHFL